MRILQINTVSGYSSTGRTCVELADFLEKKGHDSYIAYGQGATSFEKSYKIGGVLENHLHNIGSRLYGKQGYFSTKGTINLIKLINKIDPDVIHLRNLHGNYLNIEILFDYLLKVQKPVVWSLHDCWAFTGKCAHYTDATCYKWETECHTCPQVKKYPASIFLDQTKKMFRDKSKWFNSINNLTIVPVSKWLETEVKKSFFKYKNINQIYNWINHDIFKPLKVKEKVKVKAKYGISSAKFIVLCVSAAWNSTSNKYVDVIKLSNLIDHNTIQIVLVGKIKKQELTKNIIHLPYLHGEEELSKIYSIADTYVHLSTEDTFGKVIAEAMSCGTPAIVYNSTACPEIIGEGCGYVVEKRNVRIIYEKIQIIKENGKKKYSSNCRNYAIDNFDLDTNINKTIKCYNQSLENNVS